MESNPFFHGDGIMFCLMICFSILETDIHFFLLLNLFIQSKGYSLQYLMSQNGKKKNSNINTATPSILTTLDLFLPAQMLISNRKQ